MPDSSIRAGERKWVVIAIAIILLGIVVAVLHRLDYVPLWLGTLGTVMMGIGALLAALAAARSYRNEDHG
jgi:protein-S-isoprenylcysteine O-methyltransferase Ste14